MVEDITAGAGAALNFGGLYAALKRRSSTVVRTVVVEDITAGAGAAFNFGELCGTTEAVAFSVRVTSKIKVKGVGQECPTHTGRGQSQEARECAVKTP